MPRSVFQRGSSPQPHSCDGSPCGHVSLDIFQGILQTTPAQQGIIDLLGVCGRVGRSTQIALRRRLATEGSDKSATRVGRGSQHTPSTGPLLTEGRWKLPVVAVAPTFVPHRLSQLVACLVANLPRPSFPGALFHHEAARWQQAILGTLGGHLCSEARLCRVLDAINA